MKKVLSAVITLSLLLSILTLCVFAATAPTVYTETSAGTLNPGDTFTYDVYLSGTYAGYSLNVNTSQNGITVTGIAPVSGVNADNMGDYWTISVAPNEAKTIEKTKIATVTAVVDAGASAGVRTLDFSEIIVIDENYDPASVTEELASVTVQTAAVSVTGVTLDTESLTLNVGETGTVAATVAPVDAANKNITWTSSDETVATVADGVITALKAGTATITATTEDGGYTDTVTVTVTAPAAANKPVVYTETSAGTLNPGDTFTYDVYLSGTYTGYSLKVNTSQNGITVTGITSVDGVNADNKGDSWEISVSPADPKTIEKTKIATVTAVVDADASVGVKTLGFSEIIVTDENYDPVSVTEGLASVTVSASLSIIASGTCGKYITWMLTSDGTLTITGFGVMWEFRIGITPFSLLRTAAVTDTDTTAPWYDYRESITSVVITEGVSTVGSGAFSDCTNLTSVSVAETVTHIGDNAFSSCENLSLVSVEGSETTLAESAFAGNTSVTLQAPAGSAAETFASENNISFEVIPTGVILTGTAAAWDNTDNALYYLYPADMDDADIRAQWKAGTYETAGNILAAGVGGEIVSATVDGKSMYAQSFSFEGVANGTYKLVIMKPGQYVPKIVVITVSGAAYDAGVQKMWLYGDVNADGKVSTADSMQINRRQANKSSIFETYP